MTDFLTGYIMVLIAVVMTLMAILVPWSIYMDWTREQQAKSRRKKAPATRKVTAMRSVRGTSPE